MSLETVCFSPYSVEIGVGKELMRETGHIYLFARFDDVHRWHYLFLTYHSYQVESWHFHRQKDILPMPCKVPSFQRLHNEFDKSMRMYCIRQVIPNTNCI